MYGMRWLTSRQAGSREQEKGVEIRHSPAPQGHSVKDLVPYLGHTSYFHDLLIAHQIINPVEFESSDDVGTFKIQHV